MIEKLVRENIDFYDLGILNRDDVLDELEINPYGNYLVYIENNVIIGYIYYSVIYDRTEVNYIEVREDMRNKLIGSKLLEEYLRITKAPSTLEVSVENSYAIKLYTKYGYKRVAMRKNYYNGIDGILMERKG